MSVLEDADSDAKKLVKLIQQAKKILKDYENKLCSLEELGILRAKCHWRDGKYLYLIYPTTEGQREREYVGSNREKVSSVIAAVNRAAEFDALNEEMRKVKHQMLEASTAIRTAKFLLDFKALR